LPYLRLSRLEFASLLQYPTRSEEVAESLRVEARGARNLVLQLKGSFAGSGSIEAATRVAGYLRSNEAARSVLAPHIMATSALVPLPRSALPTKGGNWPSRLLAEKLLEAGFGGSLSLLLERAVALPKSAVSLASQRPTVFEKFESLRVVKLIDGPTEVCLIDDVVTTGSELLAAANRIVDAYPGIVITAFAAARTMSGPPNWPFTSTISPVSGTIELRGQQTWRNP
jgi:hypothetical protein